MLASLSIRDVVLIDKLELDFDRGLCALTGETGAGKSILLDALGLALGSRADVRLLRPGSDQAKVTAVFDLATAHPVREILQEQEITLEEDHLVLRRVLGRDGRSRAFVNDQTVSVGLLRRLGDRLIEVQGQFEQRGLLDSAQHRRLLDSFGGLSAQTGKLAALWGAWRAAQETLAVAERQLAQARQDESFLRHAVEELARLDPKPGEEPQLAAQRNLLLHRERLIEAVQGAYGELSGDDGAPGAETALGAARGLLDRVADKAGDRLGPVLESLERASAETEEALAELQAFAGELAAEGGDLAMIEERYFGLQDLARKHNCPVAGLPDLRETLAARLAALDGGTDNLTQLSEACGKAKKAYVAAAEKLTRARRKAAAALDKAVNAELPPLRLERALFQTSLEPLAETGWSGSGQERIAFQVATNPGTAPGPIGKIASGGELARFLLALKVVLAEINPEQTLVFDEVDSGVGGATAHAVGERLARLAAQRQVLAVTHSPQVAARAAHHWQVRKEAAGKSLATEIEALSQAARREEIARMLSGAQVTEEARAAAERLLGAA